MLNLNPEQWVQLYADDMLRYALFRIRDQNVCEDLVQDTFLAALKGKDGFKGNSSEKTWLWSILKNKIIDAIRKQSKENLTYDFFEKDIIDDFFGSDQASNGHWKSEQVPKESSNSALEKLLQKEYIQTLRFCIAKLKEPQRLILQEKYFNETSSDEICKDIGLSKSNYWVIMHRINLQLRKCLETNWFTT